MRTQKKLISKGEIYFAPISAFEDQFDCHIDIKMAPATLQERFTHLSRHLQVSNASLTPIQAAVHAQLRSGFGKAFPYVSESELKARARKTMSERNGILSLSRTLASFRMWEKYGDNHRGICVGLSPVGLDRFIEDFARGNRKTFLFRRQSVSYRAALPTLNPFRDHDNESIRNSLMTKTPEWKFEEEERIVMAQDLPPEHAKTLETADRTLTLPKDVIEEVWLGKDAPHETQEQVQLILSKTKSTTALFKVIHIDCDGHIFYERLQ